IRRAVAEAFGRFSLSAPPPYPPGKGETIMFLTSNLLAANALLRQVLSGRTMAMALVLASGMLAASIPAVHAQAGTERVSVSSQGTQGNHVSYSPTLSADGRFVAFVSYASNLVPGDTDDLGDIFVHDRLTGMTERVSVSSAGEQANNDSGSDPPSLS